MLTANLMNQAHRQIHLLEVELELQNKINQTIKKGAKPIAEIMANYQNDPQRFKSLLENLCEKVSFKVAQMEQNINHLQRMEQTLKYRRALLNKQANLIKKEKQSAQVSIEQMKQTIYKMEKAIKSTIETQAHKRRQMQQQTQKSLKQIQNKISSFQKQAKDFQKDSQALTIKKYQIEQKLSSLQLAFKKQQLKEDQQVKKEKQGLIIKLQSMEEEVSEVTELNKDYSAKQKSNFDRKLSLYLKVKKFPQHSASFQSSAKTIDQCKEQLLKGIQRLNQANDTINKFQDEAKNLCDQFTNQFKRRDERQAKIQKLKKEKQFMKQRIIKTQNKIKSNKKRSSQAVE